MGNCIQALSERVTLIASDDTWIEGNAIQQLHTTARLAGMRRVAGMPDLHPGRGYPVGAAFSTGRLYPALIGGDIGCGMSLWSTGIDARKAATAKLEKRLGDIDGPLDDSWQPLVDELAPADVGHRQALGTIGGGNHFAELQRIDTVCDPQAVDALGLDLDRLVLLVHSGSRGLGRAILEEHVQRHGHDGLAEDSADCQAYLAWHDAALRYAQANRQLVARRMLDRLGTEGGQLLDVHHNLVTRAEVQGERGWLHRKGATPSDGGLVVIPARAATSAIWWRRFPARPASTRWRMARAASGCAASARTGCSSATAPRNSPRPGWAATSSARTSS